VHGDIQVALLTIQPGVVVCVDPGFKIEVLSTLSAVGTSNAPIVFTVPDPSVDRWKGIRFANTPPGSSLRFCIIEYSDDSGIKITDSSPSILDCDIRRNSSVGNGGGIVASLVLGDLTLTRCRIYDNSATGNGGGVHASMASGTLLLDHCTLSRNLCDPGSISSASHSGSGLFVEGNVTIQNSLLSENDCVSRRNTGQSLTRGGGVYMQPHPTTSNATFLVENSYVEGNDSRALYFYSGVSGSTNAQAAGVYLADGSLTMSNCVLAANELTASGGTSGNSRFGSAFMMAAGTATLENCTIARNGTVNPNEGVYVAGGAADIRNTILWENNPVPGSNPPMWSAQILGGGTINVTYSCVQGTPAYPGTGNINFNPILSGSGVVPQSLSIVPGSPCMDSGDPGPTFDDGCQPPAVGTSRNDMGAHGGPGACGWDLDAFSVPWPVLGEWSASSADRNGGSNPLAYQTADRPIIGTVWDATVTKLPTEASIVVFFGGGPRPALNISIGALLCQPPVLGSQASLTGNHSVALPLDPSLLAVGLCTQGLILSSLQDMHLTNAVDLTLGSF